MASSHSTGTNKSARERFQLRRGLLARRFKKEAAANAEASARATPDIKSAAKLQELVTESAQLRETIVRQKSEFDNFRKRAQREKEQIRTSAQEELVSNLLPVIDNFQRALDSSAQATEAAPIRQGVEMVAGQLMKILQDGGLSRIEALSTPFNPQEHEALAMEERNDFPDNHVSEVLLPGYRFRDKVLRAAMVKVAKNPAEAKA